MGAALFGPAQLPRSSTPFQIVVVGGSFAGVAAAQQCAARGAHVTLVEPREGVCIAYAVLRAAIVGGSEGLGIAVVPLDRVFPQAARRGGRCRIVRGWAASVDLQAGHVLVREAPGAATAGEAPGATAAVGDAVSSAAGGCAASSTAPPELLRLPYSVLILATGTMAAYAPVKMDDLCNVAALRSGTAETSAAAARARHFVVCGGGATGVDVATELRQKYPKVRVTLVHRGPTLLSNPTYGLNYSTAVRANARKQLEARGIEVLCETEVIRPPRPTEAAAPLRFAGLSIVLGEMELELSGRGAGGAGAAGRRLRCDYLIFATGPQPTTRWLRGSLPEAAFSARGQLRVDSAYRVRGCGSGGGGGGGGGGDVFALGDVCDSLDPKTAAVLPFVARAIAGNIVRLVRSGGLDAGLERGSGAPRSVRIEPLAPASDSRRGIAVVSRALAPQRTAASSPASFVSSSSASSSASVLPEEGCAAEVVVPAADLPPCALLSHAASADTLLWSLKQERAKRNFIKRFARQAGYSYGELVRLHKVAS